MAKLRGKKKRINQQKAALKTYVKISSGSDLKPGKRTHSQRDPELPSQPQGVGEGGWQAERDVCLPWLRFAIRISH